MERGVGGHAAWAYFLRADTMHSLYTYLEQNPGRSRERFHERSHGEGFLEILSTRANQRGFYLMDEPDAPLSFIADLSLVALLHQLAAQASQMIVVTHSPVIAAAPGAHILELGGWGFRPARWEDLELVHSWRGFLSDPALYLSHLTLSGGPERVRRAGPKAWNTRRLQPERTAVHGRNPRQPLPDGRPHSYRPGSGCCLRSTAEDGRTRRRLNGSGVT